MCETGARTVAAQDARDARLHGAHEWVHVNLALCPVVDVRALLHPLLLLLAANMPSETQPDFTDM